MSYRANVDIVIALNTLQISSFRKQGHLRFKLTLMHRLGSSLEHTTSQVSEMVRSST